MSRSLATRGLSPTIEKWQAHWSHALVDEDLDFLINEAHCNHVRLPIGYFNLGPDFCTGTPFEGEPAQVYRNTWSYVITICNKLANVGISVLIDMHASPGGANKDAHSGTSIPVAGLWGNKCNLALAEKSLLFVAKEIVAGKIPNCAGIQICNEAAWQANGMYDFYANLLSKLSSIDKSIPMYISDAWKLDAALDWTRKHNNISSNKNLVIIDTHKYYTFDEKDKSKAPQDIIRIVPEALKACDSISGNVHQYGAAPVYIGEYSCVMDTKSWSQVPEAEKERLTQQFGHVQCHRWLTQSCGSAFWTLKMAWMPGGDWGFVAQTRNGNIKAPAYFSLSWDDVIKRAGEAGSQKDRLRQQEITSHTNYWDNAHPRRNFEHWRFHAGWDDGWNDALAFFGMRKSCNLGVRGGDRIGCLDGWIRKRLTEAGQSDSSGWEYEHGFRNAVAKAEVILLRESH